MSYLTRLVILVAFSLVLACRQRSPDLLTDAGPGNLTDTIPFRLIITDTTDAACMASFEYCPRVSYSYPQFTGPDAGLNAYLNKLVLDQFRTSGEKARVVSPAKYVRTFFEENRKTRTDLDNEDTPSWGWEQILDIRVFGQRGKYLSLSREWVAYTGGAHEMFLTTFLNLDLDRKAILDPAELLDISDPELKRLGESCFRKALRIPEGKSLSEAGYFAYGDKDRNIKPGEFYLSENFAMGDSGITFLYNSYEIAAYAMGIPAFSVPYAELKTFLKIDPGN